MRNLKKIMRFLRLVRSGAREALRSTHHGLLEKYSVVFPGEDGEAGDL
jgi:hypothetical protein